MNLNKPGLLGGAWARPRGVLCAAGLAAALVASAWAQPQPEEPPAPEPTPPAAEQPAPPAPQPPTTPEVEAPTEPQIPTGAETELVLRDGRRIVGLMVSLAPDRVILSVSGIATPFERSTIERVRALPSVEERYRELRASIDDEDTQQLLQLAEWLRSRGRLELALWEVDHVLGLEPHNQRASELKVWIVEQQKVAQARAQARVERQAAPVGNDDGFPLLSPDQINMIRVLEVDLKDPPRMIIPREAVRQFLDTYAGRPVEGKGAVPSTPEGREMFLRQKPAEILAWFFDLRARELYPMVQIMENPLPLRIFRDEVNRTWLTNNCATSKCHGGEDAGRLWLYNKRSNSDASAYTNFLILDRFKTSSGLGLIDYAQPARSPLLEMGLPRDQAVFKHPEVDSLERGRWRPAFRDRNDEKFRSALDWIRAMYPQRTGYPVEYTPPQPRSAAATQADPAPR
jgi:hypothetical protein